MEKETVRGKTEKAAGHVKEAAGDLTGNNKMKAEGVKDQAKGQLQETVGAVKKAGKEIAAGAKEGKESARRKA